MRRLKLFAASLLMFLTLSLAVQPAGATNVFKDACGAGSGGSAACADHTTANPLTGNNGALRRVTRIVATISGAVAVIMMVAGGIMYIFSGGDNNKVSNAKNTVLYASVGLVVIVLAQALIVFVLSKI